MVSGRTLIVAVLACILAAPAVRAESLERPRRRRRDTPTEPNWSLRSPQVEWILETGELSVSVTVENSGEGDLPPTTVRVWLRSERKAYQSEVPGLPQGSTQVVRVTLPGQEERHRGPDSVVFELKAENHVSESNYSDNRASAPVPAKPALPQTRPDLAIAGVSDRQTRDGAFLTLSVRVTNLGGAASEPSAVRAECKDLNPEPMEAPVPPVPPGREIGREFEFAVPDDKRGSTVHCKVWVEPAPGETNKENNQRAIQVKVPELGTGSGPKPALPIVPIVVVGAVLLAGAAAWFIIQRAVSAARSARLPEARTKEPTFKMAKPKMSVETPRAEAEMEELGGSPREAAMPPGAAATTRRKPADDVYFTVTSPAEVVPKADFLVNVWAHLDAQREEVLKRAHQAEPKAELQAPGKGPFAIARDTELDVLLSIEDCSVEPAQETIRWTGAIANADFAVRVNDGAPEGNKRSYASIRHGGLEIARVRFLLKVTSAPSAAAVTEATGQPHRRAFASYARDDSHDVLTCIQGMEKALPGMSIFLDVLKFRSGEYWQTRLQQEILESDVFYLFWSKAAADSEWVEKEWRFGLDRKGLDFIDPVPLVSPRVAPPPPELSSKHFDDRELAFKSYQEGAKRRAATAAGGTQPQPCQAMCVRTAKRKGVGQGC